MLEIRKSFKVGLNLEQQRSRVDLVAFLLTGLEWLLLLKKYLLQQKLLLLLLLKLTNEFCLIQILLWLRLRCQGSL